MITQLPQLAWDSPETLATSDDTLLTASATTMKFANIPSDVYKPDERCSNIEVSWQMGANGQSCVVYLFAARTRGDIVLAFIGTLTGGTQVATSTRVWVDTIANITKNWITDINTVDIAGNNRMSRILLPTCGYNYFFCQYTGLSSESVKAYYSGYSNG